MNGRFLHIYLKPNTDVTYPQIEKQMNLALDWFKYDQHVWIVYSTAEIEKWNERLKPLAGSTGVFFVCEIDASKRTGWMAKSFWEWLKKDRSKK
jgi:hypothetical protein